MPFTYTYRLHVILGAVGLVVLLSFSALVQAETKTIVSEATYIMGDGETPSFAETMALQKAKQTALEEVGTYVQSYTRIHNLDLTEEEIVTVAGGVLRVEVLDKKRMVVDDGFRFFVRIKAEVATDAVEDLAQRVKGKNLGEDYRKLLNDYARLSQDFETLKHQVKETPPGPEREAILDQIREREKAFLTVQENEVAFFRRLVAGEELFRKAARELSNKQNQQRKHQVALDQLFKEILDRGHIVRVGEPEIETDLKMPDDVILTFPLSVKTNKANHRVTAIIQELKEGAYNDGTGGRRVKEFLDGLRLMIELAFQDGSSQKCFYTDYQMYSELDSPPFIEFIGGSDDRQARMVVSLKTVKAITDVHGQFIQQANPVLAMSARSSLSEDLNRELGEELKKIKKFDPASKTPKSVNTFVKGIGDSVCEISSRRKS